ncbi:SIR2 family protein [Kribbella sp. NPDC049584]|uniref:SIR2 family protein n=1 Tax=Kribbella sp. NPDC049584 TaxID=3154833 RepID=UPI003441C581
MGEKSNGLDAMTMLATGMHAQPGVYAVLLGSGVSTGAGIPTGWGVMTDLVRKAAIARDPDDTEGIALAAAEPEQWWAQFGDGASLDYSNLLEQLAPTGPARQGTLRAYFEASDEEIAEGRKIPTSAHRAIAALVRRGTVRVVITTNFDRLMEQALEVAGVSPQVIHRADQIPAMTPLPHAKATVIKVHGDYHDQDMRNTAGELTDYPDDLVTLLHQVFDEYGLVISGWSADWDRALVKAVEGRRSRRYPLYWDRVSSGGHKARELLAQHSGVVVEAMTADELFTGVLERVEALDRLTEPPLTTAIAVSRLKRYLPDPLRRIDLHDLVMDAVELVVDEIASSPLGEVPFDQVYAAHRTSVQPLLPLLLQGVWFDEGDVHSDLWIDVLQRLLDARVFPQQFNPASWSAQHYPALLALSTMGLAAVRRKRERLFVRLLTEPTWRSPHGAPEDKPAAVVLSFNRVLDDDAVNSLARWDGTRWMHPASHLVRADLRELSKTVVRGEEQYTEVFDAVEYRISLAGYRLAGRLRMVGEFIGEEAWRDKVPRGEINFRQAAERSGPDWPWATLLGQGTDEVEEVVQAFRATLVQAQRW